MSPAQFALRWILMFEAVTCAIPGAKRPEQAEQNSLAAGRAGVAQVVEHLSHG